MAITNRQVLTVDQSRIILPTQAMSAIGIGISGTWTGTITFRASNDGVNFNPVGVLPFPPAGPLTLQNSTTVNGNFWQLCQNFFAFDLLFSRTTGSPSIVMAASTDDSYQDAFLAASSKFSSQEATGGVANTLIQAAQANRAWRLRTLMISFAAAPGSPVQYTVTDGASAVLWKEHVPAAAGGYLCKIPVDPANPGLSGGGITNTPGNSMQVNLAAPGGTVTSEINAEFIPA